MPMTEQQKSHLAKVTSILITLSELNGSPESVIYLSLGCDLIEWAAITDSLIERGWISIHAHFVSLTPKGREIAAKWQEALEIYEKEKWS